MFSFVYINVGCILILQTATTYNSAFSKLNSICLKFFTIAYINGS